MDFWITSDTHYGHANIVKGVSQWEDTNKCRSFSSVKEMNETLVYNINTVVKPTDTLIHLGDWSLGGKDNVQLFKESLHVETILLVPGNHDYHLKKYAMYQTIIIEPYIYERTFSKQLIIFCHFPIASWNHLSKGSWMLHGHTHLTPQTCIGPGRIMDVGIDTHPEFRPYHLYDEIFPLLKDQPIQSLLTNDHHNKLN